jgi:hypothetical protein
MDWVTAVEWGIAATIAIGAKREMGAFRTMFQSTLDKLVATQEAQGKDIAALKAQSAETNQAVAGLAGIVASAIIDDDDTVEDDGDTGPGPIN